MPAAIPLVIAGVSAASSIYGAKKGAKAAKDAAATQTASADKALELQRQMYEQQQTNLAPYRSLGNGSLGNLANFQSFAGVPGSFGAGVNSQYQHALSPGFQMPAAGPAPGSPPPGGAPPPAAVPRGMIGRVSQTLGAMGQPQAAPQQPQQPGQGQMVMMRAPDGETMAIQASDVAHYIGKGAQVVQGGA